MSDQSSSSVQLMFTIIGSADAIINRQAWSIILALIWFGYIARLSQWGRGGYCNFLVQMNSTCLRYARGKGAGVSTLWFTYLEIQMAEYDPEGDEGGGELHEKGGGQQAVPFPAPAHITWSPRGGSFSQKIMSQLTSLSWAKRAITQVFPTALWNQLWVSRLCTPAYRGLRVHDSRLSPNQTLVSYTLHW